MIRHVEEKRQLAMVELFLAAVAVDAAVVVVVAAAAEAAEAGVVLVAAEAAVEAAGSCYDSFLVP